MKLTQEQLNELIYALQGSCSTIAEQLEMRWELSEDDLTMEDFLAIDDAIFCCTECNWWCPVSEETATAQGEDEFGCSDCYPEKDEDA
jgi:hypothetical protein